MDLFSTNTLVKVVQNLKSPTSFLLDLIFRGLLEDPSEEIHFDLDDSRPHIAPYVSPVVAGKVITDSTFQTKTFRPPYVKDLRRINPKDLLKRSIGERIGGEMNPAQRMQLNLGLKLQDQLRRLTFREEVQAAEALRLGQVTVSGEGFPTQVVSFGRHASLREVMTGNARWTVAHASSNPLKQIEDKAAAMQAQSGAVLTDVVLAPDAATAFRERLAARDEWRWLVDSLRGSTGSSFEFAPGNGQKARLLGTLGQVTYWSYDDVYVDPVDNTDKHLMPSGEVLLLDRNNVEGVRCYGAIQDIEALEAGESAAARYFPKTWVEKNPSVRWLLLQSAPLMVPFRVNATASMEVLNGGA